MRNNPRAGLVLVIVAIVAFAVVRLGRGAPLALLIGAVFVVGMIYAFRYVSALSLRDRERHVATKDVTPRELALRPGPSAAAAARAPEVIVVDPRPDDIERLESKLDGLDRLRRNGLITDAEYEAKRAQIIAEI
jgi:hypothetical protein